MRTRSNYAIRRADHSDPRPGEVSLRRAGYCGCGRRTRRPFHSGPGWRSGTPGGQLPDGIGELLLAEERAVERFDSEEFLHRIQQRLGGSAADAELATRAVMSTIVDAVSDGEKVAFVNQLPLGYSQFCFEQVS